MKSRPPLSRAFSALLLPLCLALAAPAPAQQDYPTRPIRFITAAAQGGTSDILARTFAAHLTESLKQPVVVDNRASASGVIAGELTANAPPDGYTLLLAYHQHTVNAALNPMVVNPATPVKNLAEFVEWTKNFKGSLNYGSAGIGTGGHLAGELYKQMTGVKAEHIPYKGSGPALMDLLAGQYHFNFSGMQSVQTLVRSGKLRGLAVTAPRRLAALPDLPAVAEVLPGFEVVGWYGVIGPAGLPKPIVTRLHDELVKILNRPDIRERIVADGSEPAGTTPEDFRLFMLADLAKWARLVKESGAKLD